jgi:hypothetical protein
VTERKATYFALQGTLVKEDDAGDFVPVVGDQMELLIEHILHALNVYAYDGFYFADVNSSGTLTTGTVRIEWNDDGLGQDEGRSDDAD